MSEAQKEYKIDGRPATIFRTVKNKDNPYVIIDRRPVDNPELSFKAKGILTYLMSRPDGWEVSVTDLVRHGKDGEAAIRSGLKELREAGHMKYTTSRKEGRITGWLIEVYEVPLDVPQSPDSDFQEVENLQVENLQVENQDVENRTQVLSTLSNTDSNQQPKHSTKPAKKGDMLDCYLDSLKSPGAKKSMLKLEIESEIASKFRNNPTNKRWQDFIDYAARMQQENGWEIKTFLDWVTAQRGFDLNFWPPDKMRENYPRAFVVPAHEQEMSIYVAAD